VANLGRGASRDREGGLEVVASQRSARTRRPMTGSAKQSISPSKERVDCFVARAPRNDGRGNHRHPLQRSSTARAISAVPLRPPNSIGLMPSAYTDRPRARCFQPLRGALETVLVGEPIQIIAAERIMPVGLALPCP